MNQIHNISKSFLHFSKVFKIYLTLSRWMVDMREIIGQARIIFNRNNVLIRSEERKMCKKKQNTILSYQRNKRKSRKIWRVFLVFHNRSQLSYILGEIANLFGHLR